MVRRTARRGDFAGRDFFGCAAFGRTNCPGKIDIGAISPTGAPPAAGASVQAVLNREQIRAGPGRIRRGDDTRPPVPLMRDRSAKAGWVG
jgi:hypothetical protein